MFEVLFLLPRPPTLKAKKERELPIKFIEDKNGLIEGLLESIDYDEDLEEDPLSDFYEGKDAALEQLGVEAREVASFENDIDHTRSPRRTASPWSAKVAPRAASADARSSRAGRCWRGAGWHRKKLASSSRS